MLVKCEEPIDELTVQVWLLYHHPNFEYCTLFVSGTELRTDRQMDDPITRCSQQTFQAGDIKIKTRGAAVIGCAPVVSFCCKGLYYSKTGLQRISGDTSKNFVIAVIRYIDIANFVILYNEFVLHKENKPGTTNRR